MLHLDVRGTGIVDSAEFSLSARFCGKPNIVFVELQEAVVCFVTQMSRQASVLVHADAKAGLTLGRLDVD